jgi:hypothetical protein
MSVAVPVTVVVEKSPVYTLLAKYTLCTTHLPTYLLQYNLHYRNPVDTSFKQIADVNARFFNELFRYFIDYLLIIAHLFELPELPDLSQIDIVLELNTLVILLEKSLTIL